MSLHGYSYIEIATFLFSALTTGINQIFLGHVCVTNNNDNLTDTCTY